MRAFFVILKLCNFEWKLYNFKAIRFPIFVIPGLQ